MGNWWMSGGLYIFAPSGDWCDVEAENSTEVTSGTAYRAGKETTVITAMRQQLQRRFWKKKEKKKKSFEFHAWKPSLKSFQNTKERKMIVQ